MDYFLDNASDLVDNVLAVADVAFSGPFGGIAIGILFIALAAIVLNGLMGGPTR